MSKRALIVFAVWQGLGATGFLFWDWPRNTAALWVMGFILLLPGNYLASFIVERFLWGSFSLLTLSITTLMIAIVVNLGLWLALYRIVRWARGNKLAAPS